MTSIFASRIKKLRTERGWTQEDLGRKLGMTRVNISNYERGRVANMPIEIINKIADIFNVSADYLLGRIDEKDQQAENRRMKEVLAKMKVILDKEEKTA